MRVMVSFVGGWGHVEPLLPLAELASEHGHDVTFSGQAAIAARLSRLGHRVDTVGPDTLTSTAGPLVPVDREAERAVMRDHFVADFGRRRAAALTESFDRGGAGLVICDEVDVGAVIAAERLGIPCVTVCVIAAGRLAAPANVWSAWEELRRLNGLVPDPGCDRMAGALAVAPLPRSFRDPAAGVPAPMRFTRPPILDRLSDADPRRPTTVYVGLGTVFDLESGDLLGRLVEAMNEFVDTDGSEAVVSTGPHVSSSDLPSPHAGVRLVEFVPLREVLGGCGVVVCHGGSGTVVAALSLGVTVVVLPMGADQPDNADRCEELGVGVVLDPLTATSAEIAEATRTAMRDRELRSNARSLGREAATQPRIEELPALRQLVLG